MIDNPEDGHAMDPHVAQLITAVKNGETRHAEIIAARITERLSKSGQHEIRRLRSAWAAAHVDADRREQAALERSRSCEHHGAVIVRLEELAGYHDARSDEYEHQRNTLLGLLFALRAFADGDRETTTLHRASVAKVVRDVERDYARASKRFDTDWNRLRAETQRKERDLFGAENEESTT